jgi:hypothetical protein
LASQGKKQNKTIGDLISMEKKLGVMLCTCHPSYSEKPKIGGPWIVVQVAWAKSKKTKITREKKAWRHGSGCRVPASQA